MMEQQVETVRSLSAKIFPADAAGPVSFIQETALERKISLLEMALDASSNGVMITDTGGGLIYRNRSLFSLLDLATTQAFDRDWRSVFTCQMKDSQRLFGIIEQILSLVEGETFDIFERIDGRLIECHTRIQPMPGEAVSYRLWSFADCTEQQHRERELTILGMHDPLTGIYNRAYFEIRLRQLRVVKMFPVCLFMIDVDGLKRVNDQFGHPAGDQLLRKVAMILRQACRADDIVARLGGDEFVLLLPRANAEVADQIAARVQGLLNLHNMRSSGAAISLSSGYALANQPSEMEDLLARADKTMYTARRARRAA